MPPITSMVQAFDVLGKTPREMYQEFKSLPYNRKKQIARALSLDEPEYGKTERFYRVFLSAQERGLLPSLMEHVAKYKGEGN